MTPRRGSEHRTLVWTAPVVILALTTAAMAGFLGLRAVLFPEGIALAYGAWVLRRDPWTGLGSRLVVAPTVCAAAGVALTRSGAPLAIIRAAAFIAAALLLWLLRASLGPALSAALLPTVFHVTSWIYPIAVAVIAATVSIGVLVGTIDMTPRASTTKVWWPARRFAAAACLIIIWLECCTELGLPVAAAAPPLFVSVVELTTRDHAFGQIERCLSALIIAFALGELSAWLIPWEWVAATMAVSAALLVMTALHAAHPPVAAISLVPFVAGPPESLTAFTSNVVVFTISTALLLTVSAALTILKPFTSHPAKDPNDDYTAATRT